MRMDPMDSQAAVPAAQVGLARVYLQVFELVRRRAREGDAVARGFERELTQPYLPPPAHPMVRTWLANVSSERRVFNRSSDPYVARQLLLDMQAAERRAPGLTEAVWAQAVASARAGTASR
jgi:hypothetical protein